MGRKIKHYSSGYQIRRKKQKRLLGSALFAILLAVLVFVGYAGAKALSEMHTDSGKLPSTLESLDTDALSDENNLSSSVSFEEQSESEDSAESLDNEISESSSEVQTLYSKYGDVEKEITPVKENPFTAYGAAAATYTPLREVPKKADDEPLQAVTMPLSTALSNDSAKSFIDTVDTSLYNAVIIPLKDSEGIVYYHTSASTALQSGAVSSSQVDLERIIAMIREKGLKPAASIYSLQDHTSAHTRYGTSYFWMNDGSTTWLDAKVINGGKPWMNPYCKNTIAYLNTIASELDQAGFVDLIVYGNQYPDSTLQQKMGLGETGGISKPDQLEKVLQSMQDAAPAMRVIPAYQGGCYTSGINTQVYTDTPNIFSFTPSAPIIGSDLSILDKVTADVSTLIPVISDSTLSPSLSERGISSYIVQ